jgi:acyl carrier protein
MDTLTRLTRILRDTLMPAEAGPRYDPKMRLLGSVPGLDSIAVVSVLTAIENEFGFTVEDDEMSADVFETVGSLEEFVNNKLAARPLESSGNVSGK